MPSAEAATQLLARFEPFNGLAAEGLADLAPLLVEREFRLGQTLLELHTLPPAVYCILQGQLRILAPSSKGVSSRTIDRLGPGSLVGWCSSGQPIGVSLV
jgi:CRP-like cAMP-binding protein